MQVGIRAVAGLAEDYKIAFLLVKKRPMEIHKLMNALNVLPNPVFLAARPVWPEGRAREKNLLVAFRDEFPAEALRGRPRLRVTGATCYRVFLNGRFLGRGPA